MRAIFSSQPVEIRPDEVLFAVGDETVALPNDDVFVFAGGVPPFDFLRRIGVRFGDEPAEPAAAEQAAKAELRA